ncbi:aspartic proteinase CDR1-like [Prosopis cineraria]|uniref:aspartic proteinase CDR1-like n=1 Tax=Prosopis cineraria TaxID=364024 RepID=UPI00240EBC4B|nr:aspartic proteinase CDR1-like [Prosopis cineraria]
MNYLFPNKASTINDDDPRPTLVGQDGEYIMEYSLGNPMFETYGVIDTGSDFTWLQCLPCIRCFNQGDLDYLHTDFNVGLHAVDCTSPLCIQIVNPSVTEVLCDADNCQCKYMMEYSDGSTSAGDVFHTLLRLQTTPGNYVGFPRFIFGCSRETTGDFSTIASGIIGLGRAPASMISQIYDYIDGKFAYCLVPMGQDAVSEMRFGQIAVISGPGIIYTPMIPQILTSDNYHILMEGITVGDVYVPYLEGDKAVLGTILQANFMVSFDLERKKIGFKKMNFSFLEALDPLY